MYFSKLIPNYQAAGPLWVKSTASTNPYRLHQTLYDLFPNTPSQERPFLYREDLQRRGAPNIYLLSQKSPTPPDTKTLPWDVVTKAYHPQIRPNDRLVFSLRANAVVCQNGRRHDVVMAKIHPLKRAGTPFDRQQIIREAGLTWLHKQATQKGFTFDEETLLISGYRQHKLSKTRKDDGSPKRFIQFTTMDFDGCLNVTDVDRFLKALQEGMGRAKGFGCGLLLIKRA